MNLIRDLNRIELHGETQTQTQITIRGRRPHPHDDPLWTETVAAFEKLAGCLSRLSARRPVEATEA